jgi:predicted  nucleic acid-binding Zn-ribbon protein
VGSERRESGMEELLRISRQISRVDQERTRAEKEQAEKRRTVKELQQSLVELKASVALEQLKPIATPEVIKEVSLLKQKQGTEGLRKLILHLSGELERWASSKSRTERDMAAAERSMKTLAILLELLFSIE